MAENGNSRPSENPGSNKKKAVSSNLLNLKFMRRGRDAEIAAEIEKQQIKDVSDQQWHLSVIQHIDLARRTATVSYEPSYNHFESNELRTRDNSTMGRKIFGSFVPDIDDLIKDANDEDQENASAVSTFESAAAENTETARKDTKRPKKRLLGEDTSKGAVPKNKKIKRKRQAGS